MAEICKNCKTEVALNYCPACGRAISVKRIDGRYMLDEIRAAFSLEKGFLFTIRQLAVNPGQSIKDFIHEDRNRLIRPIVFLIVTSLIYAVFNNVFQFEDSYVKYSGDTESTIFLIFEWVQNNYGYSNILMAIFIGLWLKWLFRKYPFNYFEILILLCFVMGMGMLIYAVIGMVQSLTHINLMEFGAATGFIYTTFAIGHFFDKRKLVSYFKAFIAYMIGMFSFSFVIAMIGLIIDLVLKK